NLPFGLIEKISAARVAARDIQASCKQALLRQAENGRPRLPGRATCALVVIEGWLAVNGSAPGHNDPKLHDVCDADWHASAGTQCEIGSWSGHTKAAKKIKNATRDLIRREIRQAIPANDQRSFSNS